MESQRLTEERGKRHREPKGEAGHERSLGKGIKGVEPSSAAGDVKDKQKESWRLECQTQV